MKTRAIAKWILPVLPCFLFSVPAYATQWEIETKTCKHRDADTTSPILVGLSGTKGDSMHRLGYPDRDDFEPGQVDTYRVSGPEIGDLEYVRVMLIGDDGWCFESFKVTNVASGDQWSWPPKGEEGKQLWLDKDSDSPYYPIAVCRVGESTCER